MKVRGLEQLLDPDVLASLAAKLFNDPGKLSEIQAQAQLFEFEVTSPHQHDDEAKGGEVGDRDTPQTESTPTGPSDVHAPRQAFILDSNGRMERVSVEELYRLSGHAASSEDETAGDVDGFGSPLTQDQDHAHAQDQSHEPFVTREVVLDSVGDLAKELAFLMDGYVQRAKAKASSASASAATATASAPPGKSAQTVGAAAERANSGAAATPPSQEEQPEASERQHSLSK